MTNDFSERDEMKNLQREAADLAARSGEAASTAGEERSAAEDLAAVRDVELVK